VRLRWWPTTSDGIAAASGLVASVHSRFRLDAEAQTARIVRAVSNPYTTILGHLTGRLLLRREGYGVDIDEVLRTWARHRVAVEVNANPHRLDLDWRWLRRAVDLGCMVSINPDAHSTEELDLTRWGVAIARKGGIAKEHVLNCLDSPAFAAFLRRQRVFGGDGAWHAPDIRVVQYVASARVPTFQPARWTHWPLFVSRNGDLDQSAQRKTDWGVIWAQLLRFAFQHVR
jgi:hypothetical protein